MNMNRMSLIVVGFCFFCLFWGSSLRARNTINWLAHGDLRGHFESCGCDPKTDLGGLGRFATFLKREMLETQQVIIFDLGNNFSLKTKDSEKNHYINKALIQIDPHFSLLNYTEFLLGKRILEKRTFILSNLRNNITIFPHKILAIDSIQHVSVLGFLWADDLEDHLRPMNKVLINDWKNRLKNTTKYKILLFSGNDKQLKFVEEQKIFNLIISSNDAPLKSESIYEEKENALLLERTPETLMVPWGGLGVLRGGGLKENKAPSIQQLLAPKSLNKQQQVEESANIFEQLQEEVPVTWLDFQYNGPSPLESVINEYVEGAKGKFKKIVAQKKLHIKGSKYVGAQACQFCHQKAYEVWSKSKHAIGYETLEQKNRNQDPFCISCHVVGWHNKGGFVSLQHTAHLKGIQCENCHGPRQDHITDPTIKGPSANETDCITCHKKDHSPSFDKKIYWSKIKHGKEQDEKKW